jgi:hypothetical protein
MLVPGLGLIAGGGVTDDVNSGDPRRPRARQLGLQEGHLPGVLHPLQGVRVVVEPQDRVEGDGEDRLAPRRGQLPGKVPSPGENRHLRGRHQPPRLIDRAQGREHGVVLLQGVYWKLVVVADRRDHGERPEPGRQHHPDRCVHGIVHRLEAPPVPVGVGVPRPIQERRVSREPPLVAEEPRKPGRRGLHEGKRGVAVVAVPKPPRSARARPAVLGRRGLRAVQRVVVEIGEVDDPELVRGGPRQLHRRHEHENEQHLLYVTVF